LVRGARIVRVVGGVLVAASWAGGYLARRAEGQDKYEAAVRQSLDTAGGVAGANVGVAAGTVCGPAAVACSAFLAVLLGAAGSSLGDRIGDILYSGHALEEIGDLAIVDMPMLPWGGL
jgi:hypothetical protein